MRQKDGTSGWKAWKRIPMGDGTGASGTWGISINGNASTALGVADYADTSQTIKIGFSGAGATTSNLAYIAGYLSGGTQIKDVSKDVLKSWLGLGSAAYTDSSSYAASSHGHSLSSITGGNPLIKTVDVTVTATTKAQTYSNHPNISAPTPDGYSFIGCYVWNHGHPKRHYHYCYQGNPTEVVLHNYSQGDITEPITVRFLFVKNI